MNMIKNTSLIVCLPFFFMSCTSVAHYQKIDEAVARGNYRDGLEQIKSVKDDNYQKKDRVLYDLEAGMLAHYAREYGESSKLLGSAEKNIEAAFTKSVSLEVSSYLVNDNTKEYPGEDYEDIYLNTFNALNYYYNGSTEGALVEIRRMNNKLRYLSTKYGTEITNAQKKIMEKSAEVPYDPATATVSFSNSALARYLGMLFYRGEGLRDDARIDRDQIKLAFANQAAMYPFKIPVSIQDDLDIPAGKARLNVISFSGFSPIKKENAIRIPFTLTNWIKIAVPVLIIRPSVVARTEVVLSTGERFDLEQVEDMSAVALETFKQKAALIYLKTVLRAVIKASSSVVLDAASEEANDSGTALLLGVLSFGSQIYAEASEQADLRLSRYYPSAAYVGGITLTPGTYSYTVNYYTASDKLIFSVPFENIAIREYKLNLSEAICIK